MAGADWSKPGLGDLYTDFLTYLAARDVDAITLCYNGYPTNPPTGAIAYIRASDKFQQYNGSTWVDLAPSIAGGGTGANTAAGARTNLGLGTIATQNANNVTVTGGSVTGLGTFTTNGAITVGAGITAGSGAVGIVDSTGKIPAISSTYFASLSGANLTNLNASNLASGTVAPARLGSGSGGSTKFLREDNTWQTINVAMAASTITGTYSGNGSAQTFTVSPSLTDYTKAIVTYVGHNGGTGAEPKIDFISNTQATVNFARSSPPNIDFTAYVLQGS